MAEAGDWTGFAFGGHGTICLKSLTCTAFGWAPPWSGLALGCALLAWSAWLAWNVELDLAELHSKCGRLPSDAASETARLHETPTLSLEKVEAVKVQAKAARCLADVVLDASALSNYLRQGQPAYALLNTLSILRSEFDGRRGECLAHSPHWAAATGLAGWQADFIVYWRESLALGVASPAFEVRAQSEFEGETALTSYIALSALLSSTCTCWFALGQLLASTTMGCMSALEYGARMELSWAEQGDVPHCLWDDATKRYAEHQKVRAIPMADYFARQKLWQQLYKQGRLHLVATYRLCDFLSKGVVSTALIHHFTPIGFYLMGLAVAVALKPVRGWTGHEDTVKSVVMWFDPYLMPARYPLSLPTVQRWVKPESSSPAVTAAFLSVLWAILLAQTIVSGEAETAAAACQALSSGLLCEAAPSRSATSGWHHWPHEWHRGGEPCGFELSPSSVQAAVKGVILLLGLVAQLGLVCMVIRLHNRHKGWLEEDDGRLRRALEEEDGRSEKLLFPELKDTEPYSVEDVERAIANLEKSPKTSLYALCRIAASCASCSAKVVRPRGVEAIVRAMDKDLDNATVQAASCKVLLMLSRTSVGQQRILHDGGAKLIVQSMQAHKVVPTVQTHGCGVLKELATKGPELVASQGGIEAILTAMREHRDDKKVQESACEALQQLSETPEHARLIAERDGIPLIMKAMQVHQNLNHAAVQIAGCSTLRNLAKQDEGCKLITSQNGTEAILTAMHKYPADEKVHKSAGEALQQLSETLRNLAKQDEGCKLITSHIRAIIQEMQQHPDACQLQESSCMALHTLASVPEHVPLISELGGIVAIRGAQNAHESVRDQEEARVALELLLA